MAILLTISTTSGLTINDAYGKITSVGGGKDGAVIELKFYKDKEASKSIEPIKVVYENFIPSVEDDAPNFIKQGYKYLKELPKYYEALDILEDGQTL